jgi:hypothetical protein
MAVHMETVQVMEALVVGMVELVVAELDKVDWEPQAKEITVAAAVEVVMLEVVAVELAHKA